MNYDRESRHLYDASLDNPSTTADEGWKRYEPDCSPHPFDVMAVYAPGAIAWYMEACCGTSKGLLARSSAMVRSWSFG